MAVSLRQAKPSSLNAVANKNKSAENTHTTHSYHCLRNQVFLKFYQKVVDLNIVLVHIKWTIFKQQFVFSGVAQNVSQFRSSLEFCFEINFFLELSRNILVHHSEMTVSLS